MEVLHRFRALLAEVGYEGRWQPDECLEETLLRDPVFLSRRIRDTEGKGNTMAHALAAAGWVPGEREILAITNDKGWTVAHAVAMRWGREPDLDVESLYPQCGEALGFSTFEKAITPAWILAQGGHLCKDRRRWDDCNEETRESLLGALCRAWGLGLSKPAKKTGTAMKMDRYMPILVQDRRAREIFARAMDRERGHPGKTGISDWLGAMDCLEEHFRARSEEADMAAAMMSVEDTAELPWL